MKRIAKLMLSGLVITLSMALFACSKDEPTPTPEPDAPVSPKHPQKDWQGEIPHGFIIDAKELIIPTSERGFIEFTLNKETYDEIEIDWDADPIRFGAPKLSTGSYFADATLLIEGEMADPFENFEQYVNLCIEHKFRWRSRFSQIEALSGLVAPVGGRYVCTENLTSFDVITEKYFDKNHPAGSSMRNIDGVGMCITVIPVDFENVAEGIDWYGPGWILSLGAIYQKTGRNPLHEIFFTVNGFPEQAGEYPMVIKVTMDGGKKTWEQPFTIKFVDKK